MNRLLQSHYTRPSANLWREFAAAPLTAGRIAKRHPSASALHTFYWWNLIWSALVVSLDQVFSIPYPERAFLHAFFAIFLVLAAGALILYPGMLVVDMLASRLNIRGHALSRRAVLMTISPWFIAIAVAMTMSPWFMIPALAILAALYALQDGLARTQNVSQRDAMILVLGLCSVVLVTLVIAFLAFHWDIYAV